MTSYRSIAHFLIMTFALSLGAFVLIATVPGAQSPETLTGLPIWLVAIWSPTLSALFLAWRHKRLQSLLRMLVRIRQAGPALGLLVVPVFALIAAAASLWNAETSLPPAGLVFGLLAFNLVLGPLGEELGWRGYLQTTLDAKFGWLGAALVVGAVWTLWHAPLWLVDSPQSEIAFAVFAVHAMSYAVIMGAAQRLAPDTIVPAIGLHLLFNGVAGVALVMGLADIGGFYAATAPVYALAACLLALMLRGEANCPLPSSA